MPLRLYLSVSVVFLVALRLSVVVAPPPDLSKIDELRERPRTLSVNLGIGRADVKDGVFTCHGMPQWLCGRLRERMVLEPKAVAEELRIVRERFTANWGAMMFALMPSFAFGLWLLYRNRRMRYTEHLVFALHLHAFWFIAITVLAIDFAPTETFALIAIPVYALLALRRVYGGGWMALLLRAAVLSVAYSTLVGLAIATLALVALLA